MKEGAANAGGTGGARAGQSGADLKCPDAHCTFTVLNCTALHWQSLERGAVEMRPNPQDICESSCPNLIQGL